CSRCNGAGKVQNMRKAGFATFVQVTACPNCRGKGKVINSPCNSCQGSGLMRKRRTITVKIPAGIEDGSQLRLRGEGEMAPNDGLSGDLYVIVHIKQHPEFIREGNDLWYVAILTYPQATLGAEITIPTLEGETLLKVPAGTQVGKVLVLKGKGMPRIRGYGRGDLLVRIGIYVPEKLTAKQRSLLEELAKEFGSDVKSKSRKFRF
ncbi:MAG: DnaJ C-terminal domain-containing protein, partial [Candidatus Bathyarchaeota archaeon]|nr:DnaJ C-terminal domain-containing protein [Candidatus Bathyarchaeota archaeon]